MLPVLPTAAALLLQPEIPAALVSQAVCRRMPRRLLIDLPAEAERLEIVRVRLRDCRLTADASAYLPTLAAALDGYSGSEIFELCREALAIPANVTASQLDVVQAPSASGVALSPITVAHLLAAKDAVKRSVAEDRTQIYDYNEKFGELRSSLAKKENDANHLYL